MKYVVNVGMIVEADNVKKVKEIVVKELKRIGNEKLSKVLTLEIDKIKM